MNNTEHYVSYDFAEFLDSIGYDGEYHALYAKGDVQEGWYSQEKQQVMKFKREKGYFFAVDQMYLHELKPQKNLLKAPTLESVMNWLREKYDILVSVCIVDSNTVYMGGEYYYCRIFKNRSEERKFRYNLEKFVTYEEAVNYALEYIFVNFEILSHIDNE